MTAKVYTNRSNCARAAKAALGKNAKPGVDFTIAGGGKEWTWSAAAKKPAKAKREPGQKRGPRPLYEQPKMAEIIEHIRTSDGVTVEAGAAHFKQEQHTFRGCISRLRSAGVPISCGREFKRVVYRLPKNWKPAPVALDSEARVMYDANASAEQPAA